MMKIVEWPDDALKQVCRDCKPGDKSLRRISRQMAQLMYKTNGVGIASPQVGLDIRLIVVDCEDEYYGQEPLVMVNPVIVERKGDLVESSEGCLSLPGISVVVERSPYVRVRYYDLDGELWEIEDDGHLLAMCLQHEIDHLDGKTIIEAATPERRVQAVADLAAARAAGARPGEVGVPESGQQEAAEKER